MEVFNREHVLERAMNVFWKKGYNGTSMQDLVEATGLNRSSIYNSFESKLNLYRLALNYYQRDTGLIFQKILLKSSSPLEAIKNIFNHFICLSAGDADNKGCFNLNCKTEMANHDAGIKNWLEKTQEQSLQIFQDLIRQGQEDGTINRDQSCREYAYYVFNALQGLRMTGILIKDRKVLQSIIDTTMYRLK